MLLPLRYTRFALTSTYLVQQKPEDHEHPRTTNNDAVLKSIALGMCRFICYETREHETHVTWLRKRC
jgi:hypothetical protein